MIQKQLKYNLAQILLVQSHKLINMLEGGRGLGKSVIIGRIMKEQVENLPRATGVLVGATYVQMLTRTLPSTINGLRMHGLYKDVHYFIGRRAPKSFGWDEPFEPPLDYKHCIHFYNGFVYRMVSQDRPGDGRGINSDCVIGDEAAMLDKQELEDSVLTTCRGTNPQQYKGNKYFLSQFFFTSTPRTKKGDWIFEYESFAKTEPEKYFYLKAPSYVNIHNLGSDYFRSLQKTMYPTRYAIEIECKRNNQNTESFYPLLDIKVHGYTKYDYEYIDELESYEQNDCRWDADLDKHKPLDAGLDFGAAINSLVIGQEDEATQTMNLLKNFFALSYNKEILEDVAKKFIRYYQHHERKLLYLYYDNTGNNSQANSRYTLAEEFATVLRAKEWTVILQTKGGKNPFHSEKYQLWNNCLNENASSDGYRKYPYIRFNLDNCAETIVSMEGANAKRNNHNIIQKDKSSERKLKGEKRIQATDLSDAVDALMYGKYSDHIDRITQSSNVPTHL